MALTVAELGDLVEITLAHLEKPDYTNLATTLQEYYALPQILNERSVGYDSGKQIDFSVMKKHSGAAKHTGLFAADNVNVDDVMTTGTVPWRHLTTNYAFDTREVEMNRSPAKIVDLVKVRRADSMISLAELLEEDFWGMPDDSDDNEKWFGIKYWIVQNASTGFYGGNQAGFAGGAGGISSTDVARWKNWSGGYTDKTKADMVAEMRHAMVKTVFKNPVAMPDAEVKYTWAIYTTYTVVGALESILEEQNDQLGKDVASMDGKVTFRGNAVNYVPYLEENETNDPIYGVNWGAFQPVFLEGEYLSEDGPSSENTGSHKVVAVHIDLTGNYICRNRRTNWVLYDDNA